MSMSWLDDIALVAKENYEEQPGFQEGDSAAGAAVQVDIAEIERNNSELVAAVEDDVEEMNRVNVGVDVVTSAADGVSDVAATAEEQIEETGELSPESFAVIATSVRHLTKSVGVSFEAFDRRVSMESFKGYKEDRITASKVAMEGLKESIKDLWRKIKAFFARAWEKLKKFIKEVFTAKGRMKKLVNLAKDMAAKSPGVTVKHENVKNAEKMLGVYGIQEAGGDVGKFLGVINKQCSNSVNLANAGLEVAKHVGATASDLATKSGKYNKSLDDYKAFDKIAEETQKSLSEKIDGSLDKVLVKDMTVIGGLRVDGVSEYKEARSKDRLDFASLKKIKFVKSKDKAPGLSGTVSIKDLGAALDSVYKVFEEYADDLNSYQRNRDELRQAVDKAASEAAKNEDNGAARGIKPGQMSSYYSVMEHFSPVKYVGAIIGSLNAIASTIMKNAESKVKEEKAAEIAETAEDAKVALIGVNTANSETPSN